MRCKKMSFWQSVGFSVKAPKKTMMRFLLEYCNYTVKQSTSKTFHNYKTGEKKSTNVIMR